MAGSSGALSRRILQISSKSVGRGINCIHSTLSRPSKKVEKVVNSFSEQYTGGTRYDDGGTDMMMGRNRYDDGGTDMMMGRNSTAADVTGTLNDVEGLLPDTGTILDPVTTVEATEIELVAKTGAAEAGAGARATHMEWVSTASGLRWTIKLSLKVSWLDVVALPQMLIEVIGP